jgi:hypothetical protein
VFVAVTLLLTHPVWRVITTALPANLGDPLLNAWTLAWGADRLAAGLAGFWDAPFFFPYGETLAHSEHLLGIAMLVAPIHWIAHNPVLTYNVAWLASFVHAAFGMYLLARALTGRHDAAMVAALGFAFGQYRAAAQISHVQALFSGWMPLALLALHRYFATGSRYAVFGFAGAFVMQALSSMYFLYYLSMASVLVVAYEVWRRRSMSRRMLMDAAIVLTLLAAPLAPVVDVYYGVQARHGFERDTADNLAYSAHVDSYLRVWDGMKTWKWLPRETTAVQALFPGFTLLTLALLGLRHRARDDRDNGPAMLPQSDYVRLYAAVAVIAFVLSLGPVPIAWGRQLMASGPYAWLLAVVPGLDGLRIPARLGTVVMLALSVLAAFGASRVLSSRLGSGGRLAAGTAFALLALVEGYGGPVPVAAFDPEGRTQDRALYRWLAAEGRGAVMHFPISEERRRERRVAGFSVDLFHQHGTLLHGLPIVNGGPEYAPALTRFLAGGASPLREPALMPDALAMLSALGVRHVVVHANDYLDETTAAERIRQIADSGMVVDQQQLDSVTGYTLYPVETPPVRNASDVRKLASSQLTVTGSHASERVFRMLDGDPDSRWISGRRQTGDEWIEILLDRPSNIRVLRLQMASRSLGDYPRSLIVESIGRDGPVEQVFAGSVLPQLGHALVREPSRPTIEIVLPENSSRVLRLRQTGRTRTFNWSIHELELWEITDS